MKLSARRSFGPIRCALAALAAALLAGPIGGGELARAGEEPGTFAHISDIHFDPFEPPELALALAALPVAEWRKQFDAAPKQAIANYGKDTNFALLDSALNAIGRSAAAADFAIVTGDFLSHRFEEQSAKVLGISPASPAAQAYAATTTVFVAEALQRALPRRPIILALGNNDSSCGDYRIEPGGSYLAATRETVRRLAGPELLAADFEATYAAGGYYAMRHPTVANIEIVVLNDVLWSAKYEDACGSTGLAAGARMMDWFKARLGRQKASGGKLWLVRHIPTGIDAFSTSKSKADSCPGKTVPFLREPFSSQFAQLIGDYSDVVQASFAGHVHFDGYRLLRDAGGETFAVEKIAPAISPIFGQNPGFHLFTYDRKSGDPIDFTTVALTSMMPPQWRREYSFAKAYGEPDYSAKTVTTIWQALSKRGQTTDVFARLYTVGRGALSKLELPAYRCAMGFGDPQSFARCYCAEQ